jgi:hypothetical protein
MYTFEMTYAYGEGKCCQCSAGEYKITVNGEPGATSSNREFRDVVRESFDVVGRTTGLSAGCRV